LTQTTLRNNKDLFTASKCNCSFIQACNSNWSTSRRAFFLDAANGKLLSMRFDSITAKRNVAQRTMVFPGEARFGLGVRTARAILDDIESTARAGAGSSRQRQDKRQVISVFTTYRIFPSFDRAVAYGTSAHTSHKYTFALLARRVEARFMRVSRDGIR